MANALIKEKQYVPAVTGRPYRPGRPAYTAIERRKVCGYVQEKSPGKYKPIRNPQTGQTTLIWIPDEAGQPIWKMVYKCRLEETKVDYPAVPAQSAIASAPAHFDYNLGWSAGARSRHSVMGDARATFQARASIVGAICGLNGHEDPVNHNGASIKFGFYFTRGSAKVMEFGAFKSASFPYDDDSVFRIDREGGQVTYWIDDELRHTSSVGDSTGDLWLQASLYSGDDEIFNPALEQISEPELTEITGELHLELPATYAAMREGFGAVARFKLPAVKVGMTLGLPAPEYALLSLVLVPPVPQGRTLVGSTGQLSLALAPPSCAVTDSPTGRLAFVLPPPWVLGRTWPNDTLPGGDGLLELDGAMPAYGICRLPTASFNAVLGGELQNYAEITLNTVKFIGVLGGEMAARGVVTLPAAPFAAVLGGSLGVLSQLNEVFVLNITNGKTGGTTQYTGYEFNSAARIGGRYYGATAEGLFLCDGDSDDGAPIDASFGPGQLNFGSPQIKTVPYCYVGASAGAMRMTMDALVNGQPAHFAYPALEHGSSMRELRFALGKGLRSTYVMPTFYNFAGSDFEVDAVRFVLAESARRI
jgi:hypothetical protein